MSLAKRFFGKGDVVMARKESKSLVKQSIKYFAIGAVVSVFQYVVIIEVLSYSFA
jgi:hypothetical protein